MSGNRTGGLKAAQKNKERYGADFYQKLGAKAGKIGRTGGFAASVVCQNAACSYTDVVGTHYIRQCAGYKGGTISRKRPKDLWYMPKEN